MKMDDNSITGEDTALWSRDLETWWRKSFMPAEHSQVYVTLPDGGTVAVVGAHISRYGDLMLTTRPAPQDGPGTAPRTAADGPDSVSEGHHPLPDDK